MYCISLFSPLLLKDEIGFVERGQSIHKPISSKSLLFYYTIELTVYTSWYLGLRLTLCYKKWRVYSDVINFLL